MERLATISSEQFHLFEHLPGSFAVALSDDFQYLWYNRNLADQYGPARAKTAKSLDDMYAPAFVEERRAVLDRVLARECSPLYYQLVRGRRCLTQVWRISDRQRASGGWFVLLTPEPHRRADADSLPLLQTSHFGEIECLSSRERVVLRLVAEGLNAAECAGIEGKSTKTIENQIAAIHTKLGIDNRAALVRFACERGLLAFTRDEWASLVSVGE